MVTLTINGKTVCVPEGTSILDAARAANIDIPTLCSPRATTRCMRAWSSTRTLRRCA